MSFSPQHIQFLQRLVQDRPETRKLGAVAQHFSEHYSIGAIVGSQVLYRPSHHLHAERLLFTHGLPVRLPERPTRADVAQFGGLSEKAFSTAPHAGSIAVRCIGDCVLDGRRLETPASAYLVVSPADALDITCDRILLVENLEPFRQLGRYTWIDYGDASVLVVYRGDRSLSTGAAAELIRKRMEPIWAFVDFDPAGLLIAAHLPPERLERLILPDSAWLREAVKTPRGRQLFDAQDAGARSTLSMVTNPSISAAWEEMRTLRAGVTQERMLGANSIPAGVR